MTQFPPRFFLRPGERILVEERIAASWAIEHVLRTVVVAAVVWGGLWIWNEIRPTERADLFSTLILVGAGAHLVLSFLYTWRRVVTTEYVITDEAVYARRGRFLLTVAASALDRVTDLHVHTSFVGRLFGFSGLAVLTAGSGVSLRGLRDAYRIRSEIQSARQELIARLLRESGTRAAPADKATAPCQCPTCQHVFDAPRTRPVDVTCPNCGETGMLFQEAPA